MADYTYIDNFEWVVDLKMVLNPTQLDNYIKNTSTILFNPQKMSTAVLSTIINTNPDLLINIDDSVIDSDRTKIYNIIKRSMMKQNGGYYLINGLLKMQKILMKEEGELIKIVNHNFSSESIRRSLLTGTYDLDLVFKNINTNDRDIPENIKHIEKYIDISLKNYDDIYNIELIGEDQENIDYKQIIKDSVISTTTHQFIDLNKACIGSIDEIVNIVDEYFSITSFKTIPTKISEYINKYLAVYIADENGRKNFVLSLQNKNKYIFINATENPDLDKKAKILQGPEYPEITINKGVVYKPEAMISGFMTNNEKIINGRQLLLYTWVSIIIIQLKSFAMELIYSGVDNNIIMKLKNSYDSFFKYFQNAYAVYYGLTGGGSPYHVDDIGINFAEYTMRDTTFRRNIGESSEIIKTRNNRFNGINKIFFKKIFYSKVKYDLYTKRVNDIAVGGIILYNKNNNYMVIYKSIELLKDYYNYLLKNKKINIQYINEIQRKMESGIHRDEVQKILIEIRTVYQMISSADMLIKETMAKAAGSILAAYLNIILKKNYELITRLVMLDSVIDKISTSNNPDSKIYQKTLMEKSKLILDLLYTQFRIIFLTKVYQRFYKYMSNKVKMNTKTNEMPIKYLTIITSDINRIIEIWNKKLTTIKNQDLVNIYKKYALLRLSVDPTQIKEDKTKKNKTDVKDNKFILDDTTLKEIRSDNFWSKNGKMELALGGKLNILVPYVNSVGAHGLINIYALARDNKKISSWGSKCIISGQKITIDYLNKNLKDKGWIILGNSPTDVDNSNTWRCLILDGTINNIPSGDIRVFVYKLLMSEKFYNKNTNFTWPDTSNTKLKIMNYCNKVVNSIKYSYCYILVSRIALYNLISGHL